jgi:hypothetical protein
MIMALSAARTPGASCRSPAGVKATAGHIQLLAQPGDGMPFSKLINQAKLFSDWSWWGWASF